MARPTKQGLDYFPLDVDFFNNEKILAISGEFDIEGEIITLRILCEIYDNGYFVEYSELLKNKLARLGGLSTGLIDEVVGKLVKYEFFNGFIFCEHNILTSEAIQKRYLEAIKRRKNYDISQYWLLNGINVCNNPNSRDINANINPQSKVKERKVKESKEKCVETHTQKIMTFQEKLSLFKEEYLNSGRFEKTCMTLNVRPDVLKKMFNEFTDAQECGSKHEGIVNYAEFSSQMSSHFFNTVKFFLKKENESKPRNGFNDTLDELLILNSD